MWYIHPTPNESGAYSAPQSNYFQDAIALTDEQLQTFISAKGFVNISQETGSTTISVNEEALAQWEADHDPFPTLQAEKEQEISTACNQAIVAGMDVETTQGTEHFSLEETDQINLTTALSAVQLGATHYPYHADGQLCRMFSAEEINSISNTAVQHKLYHTTLCNHLLTWARRCTTKEELETITYSADNLPEDLAQNMAQVLASGSDSSETSS